MNFDFSGMAGKKVLITGGCGFLGSNLARRLLELGSDVTIFEKSGREKENLKGVEDRIEFLEGDLTKRNEIEPIILGKDFVFHFGWQTDLKKSMAEPIQDISTDLIGLINILESLKNNKNAKIIFSSTVTVIGNVEKIPSNEDAKENPLSVYEANKLAAEKYIHVYHKNYGIKSAVLRLSNVFGEFQKIDNPNRGILNFMIGRALRGEILTVYGTGDFIRDYSYVQNFIDAFLFAAISEKTNGQVYVLGSEEGKTMNEVVEKIKEIVESDSSRKVVIDHVPFPGNENEINKRNFIADCAKLKNDTGWFPKISFDDGLRRTVEFYLKSNPVLK